MYYFAENKFSTIIKYSQPPGGVKGSSMTESEAARGHSRGMRSRTRWSLKTNKIMIGRWILGAPLNFQ